MSDFDTPPTAQANTGAPAPQTAERERALQFSQILRVLLQRQNFFVPLTGTYLLPQLYERVRQIDAHGIHINTLRAYLRGETLPSDSKARLLADALGIHRGVLLYAAGYLTAQDLPSYPGPSVTLASLEEDMREVEALPLAPATKLRILHDLRTSAHILRLVYAERAQGQQPLAQRDEREQLIEQLIELFETPAPPPPPYTSAEERMAERRGTGAPAPQASAPSPQPTAEAPEPPVTRATMPAASEQVASTHSV